jgi:hypothetical protein
MDFQKLYGSVAKYIHLGSQKYRNRHTRRCPRCDPHVACLRIQLSREFSPHVLPNAIESGYGRFEQR